MDNRNDYGQIPLHTTAEKGSMEVVRLYIQIGADIMAQDKDGRTPLHLAAGNGHGPAVQALLEPGDGVRGLQKQKKSGETARKVVDFLQDPQIPINSAILDKIRKLLKKTEDDFQSTNISEALHKLQKMSFEVWWLLYNLRFPDQQRFADKRVSNAIHPWLSYGSFISLNGDTHEELLQTLDEVIGKMGRLASEGNKEVIWLLVESGASINTCDDKAHAALPQPAVVLKWGVQNKYIWMVPLLLDQDVDGVTGKPDYGQTTLELAVEYRSLFTINELVQNGVNIKTANGQRALMFVVGIQGLLYELDLEVAKWGGTDARGKTALYRAAEEWLTFVVKELAEKGASIHAEYEVRSLSVQERDLQKWSVEQDDKF
ncbi:hypothetical protein OEA41_006279 [Lepraria neglecta]|uniref:Ankyrin n=1 Tax=Lepraria neglecta TaxID=209136 RepID=A0AAD9Z8P4_9LECA|nr:hypothetical protein OEA41_006279 [Lepraria neglecta]